MSNGPSAVVDNAYLSVLDHLEAANVRYAVLHGWQSLLAGKVSDLDLVVSREDLIRAESVLNKHFRILNIFQYEAASFGFVLSDINNRNDSTFLVDISTDYRCRGRILFTGQELLQSRQPWLRYWVIPPEKELEYLLVKKIYEKGGAIPTHQRARIEHLANLLGDNQTRAAISRYFGTQTGGKLADWIQKREWEQIESRVPMLQRALGWQVLRRQPLRLIRYWREELRRVCTRCYYPTGLAVTVMMGRCDADAKMVTDALQTVPHAFRRVVLLDPTLHESARTSKRSVFACMYEMLRLFVVRVQMRALVVRSALVIRNVGHAFGVGDRPSAFESRLRQSIAKTNMVFTIGGRNAVSISTLREIKADAVSSGDEQVVTLDTALPAARLAQCVREALEGYLCNRYATYRRVWFSQPS